MTSVLLLTAVLYLSEVQWQVGHVHAPRQIEGLQPVEHVKHVKGASTSSSCSSHPCIELEYEQEKEDSRSNHNQTCTTQPLDQCSCVQEQQIKKQQH